MIIHRTNLSRGRRGLLGFLTSLFGDRVRTRWMGCAPIRATWDDRRADYQRVRALELDQQSNASIRPTRAWPNDPRTGWLALYRIRRAVARATAARREHSTATAHTPAPISPGRVAVAAFSSRTSRAA